MSEPEYADPQRYAELTGFSGSWRELWWNRDFLDLMARRLELGAVRAALDVGCGAGHWGRSLKPSLHAEAKITGVDREPAFLEMARQADPDGDYREGTAESLPFEDDTFDLVTCQTVLIHVADAAVALAEMRRVLKPGGVLLAAEPDNLAGNLALLGGEPMLPDEDVARIVAMLLACDRGKRALGEGDQSIGPRVAGLMARAGLNEVRAYTNDRCQTLHPPYERGDAKVWLAQELEWVEQDVSILCGGRSDNARFHRAGGGAEADFDAAWESVRRWMALVKNGVAERSYDSARGFVMYLTAARK